MLMIFARGANIVASPNKTYPERRMLWAILSWIMIMISVLIGWQAHLTKGRSLAAWGVLAFVVLVILQMVFSPDPSTVPRRIPEDTETISQEEFSAIIAIAIGGPLVSLIVWTLPKIHPPER